jgi:GT2 family glycosyltransferase
MILSIVVLNYNTGKITCDCIDSILRSGINKEYEIIIVDNGSSDGSSGVFLKYKNNKTIKVILNSKNLGFSKGVNTGLRRSKGDYKLILNSDIVVRNGSIEKLLNFAINQENVGVVGPKLVNIDGSPQASCFNFPTVINAICEYWFGKKGTYSKYLPSSRNPLIVDCVVGAVMLITPKAFAKVGLFDERFFMYYEDIDYCKRVKENCLKAFYFPNAEFIHYHGKSGENIAGQNNQWKRLIPSSKIYHGIIIYYLINFILWSGQNIKRLEH